MSLSNKNLTLLQIQEMIAYLERVKLAVANERFNSSLVIPYLFESETKAYLNRINFSLEQAYEYKMNDDLVEWLDSSSSEV
jgi:hypothetical protein